MTNRRRIRNSTASLNLGPAVLFVQPSPARVLYYDDRGLVHDPTSRRKAGAMAGPPLLAGDDPFQQGPITFRRIGLPDGSNMRAGMFPKCAAGPGLGL